MYECVFGKHTVDTDPRPVMTVAMAISARGRAECARGGGSGDACDGVHVCGVRFLELITMISSLLGFWSSLR